MKKLLSTLLVLCLTFYTCLCLAGCKKDNVVLSSSVEIVDVQDASSNTKKTSSKKSSSKKSTSKKTSNKKVSSIVNSSDEEYQEVEDTPDTELEEISYDDIDCVTYTKYVDTHFLTTNSQENFKMRFTLSLPYDWKLVEGKNGCKILRNSEEIGTISSDIDKSKYLNTKNDLNNTGTFGNIDITHRIDSLGSGENTSFFRTLSFFYSGAKNSGNGVVIMVDYSAIDPISISKMINTAALSVTANDANIGAMKITDNRNKILILGNSFVASSEIGSTLQTMCGSSVTVEAISRGYAKVNQYARDTAIINRIKNGNYSAVFMCGFYISDDVPSFDVIESACRLSNTQLAIFPAHNENRPLITKAIVSYPGVKVLDWKGEIEELINSGLEVTDFCIMDDHLHSNALAGYVGAHMIYRAIFGNIPKQGYYGSISSSDINMLGNYSSTGKVSHAANSNVYILN